MKWMHLRNGGIILTSCILMAGMLAGCKKKDESASGADSAPSESTSAVSSASGADSAGASASVSGATSGDMAASTPAGAASAQVQSEPQASLPPLARNVFLFSNKTGKTIAKMQMAPTGTEEWQEVTLGEKPFASNTSLVAGMSLTEGVASWDMKIVTSEGTELVLSGLDMAKYKDLELVIENNELVAYVM